MNFWERVYELIILKKVERKHLGFAAGFDPSNIGKGIRQNSIPAADTAEKIAQFLGVSVKYLVTGIPIDESGEKEEYKTVKKIHDYRNLVNNLEELPPDLREHILGFVKGLARKTSYASEEMQKKYSEE